MMNDLQKMQLKRHTLNAGFQWQDVEPPFDIVSADQAEQWNTEGYFLLENVLTADELQSVTEAIDPMEEKTNEFLRTVEDRRKFIARADELTFALHPVLQSEAARNFARHSVFSSLCLDLMGPDCRLYWDQAVYKKPGCAEEFPWHQDNGYNFVLPQDYLTCWVPLVDATVNNGCPWVMPGVHRSGTLEHWHTDLGWQCLKGMEGAVPLEAKAGDIVVFSSLTPHRTGPNHSAQERKAYILQYCHDGSRMFPREGEQDLPQNHPERQFIVVRNGRPV
jgi:ectoine hydroxylase-related dioxygenase (phytanoyl-CoA dioxygenase family)